MNSLTIFIFNKNETLVIDNCRYLINHCLSNIDKMKDNILMRPSILLYNGNMVLIQLLNT